MIVARPARPASNCRSIHRKSNPACASIPASTVPTNYVVLGEVSYPFQPTTVYLPVGTMKLHDSIIMIPRVASPITVE